MIIKDRFYCYEWEEVPKPGESKFGQRWVYAGLEPLQDIWKRIRSSLQVRKDIMDTGIQTDEQRGDIRLVKIWDVTDLAKKIGKFNNKAKIDDYIRNEIPELRASRKTPTSEVHLMDADELEYRVSQYLSQAGTRLPKLHFSTTQEEYVINAGKDYQTGNIGLRSRDPRLGKSPCEAGISKELGMELTIISGYTDTIKVSYRKLIGFEQWQDYVFVDTRDPDYKKTITESLAEGKQVMAYLSMCQGGKRQERLDFLSGLKHSRYWIVEEADRGIHQPGQANALIKAVKKDDKVGIVTGTRGDKAISNWDTDIEPNEITYPELLIQKKKTMKEMKKPGFKRFVKSSLKYFDIDKERDLLYPDVEFYIMNMKAMVDECIKQGQLDDSWKAEELAGWSKYGEDPAKGHSLMSRILGSVIMSLGNRNECKVEYQLGKNAWRPKHRIDEMWVPLVKNENLEMIDKQVRMGLPGTEVITMGGSFIYNGRRIKNDNAEEIVKDVIRKAKKDNRPVMIVTARIGERSFSVGEITNLFLCFDKGEWGRVKQIIARALTDGALDKIARIWNLSFDPNRDDKFDSIIGSSVLALKKKNPGLSMAQAHRIVFDSLDFFECTKDGPKFDLDKWTEEAIKRRSMSRILGARTNMNLLTVDEIDELAKGNPDYSKFSKQDKAKTGKTFDKSNTNGKSKNKSNDRNLQKAREVIMKIYENMDILIKSSDTKDLGQIFNDISKDKDDSRWFYNEFGLPASFVKTLFVRKIIKQEWVELLHCR